MRTKLTLAKPPTFAMNVRHRYNSYVLRAMSTKSWNQRVPVLRLTLTFTLLACLAGCGAKAHSPTARDGLTSYLKALRNSDPKPAYAMLSDEEQREISYKKWAQLWQEHKQERLTQAKDLEAGLLTHGVVDAAAVLRFEDGKQVTLQKEASGWRLDQALVTRSVANSPKDALTIFSNALTAGEFAPILKILSKRHREGIATKLEKFHNSLNSELASDQEVFLVNPKRAEMTWEVGELRYRVVLVKEDGDWYIDDIHLGPDPTYDEPEPEDEEPDEKKMPRLE